MNKQMTQFQKDLVRMWDSLRNKHKGTPSCITISCGTCPLQNCCCGNNGNISFNSERAIEIVTQWAKEHPIVTYEQKYEETFGVKPVTEYGDYYCPCIAGYKCPHADLSTLKSSAECEDCEKQFWGSEYREPEKEG